MSVLLETPVGSGMLGFIGSRYITCNRSILQLPPMLRPASPSGRPLPLLAHLRSLPLLAAAPAAAATHCTHGWLLAALLEGHQLPANQQVQGCEQVCLASFLTMCTTSVAAAPATDWPAACEDAALLRLRHVPTAAAPPVARVPLAAAAAPLAAYLQKDIRTVRRCCS